MDEQRATGFTRRGISLQPDDNRAAVILAERYEGGNVSRLIGRLIRREWAIEQYRNGQSERRPDATELVAV